MSAPAVPRETPKAPRPASTNGRHPPKAPAGGYRKRQIPWGWIIGLAVLASVVFNLVSAKLNAVQPLPEGLIQANGRMEGDHVIISSKFSGRLARLAAREGDTADAGQLLMVVSDPQTEARRDQAVADLASATASAQGSASSLDLTRQTTSAVIVQAEGQLAQSEAAIGSAKADYLRSDAAVRSARAARAVAELNVDVSRTALESARANRDRSASALSAAKADLTSARATLLAADANVESARATAEQARREAARYGTLAAEGATSGERAEQAGTASRQADAALAVAIQQGVAARGSVAAKAADADSASQGIKVADATIAQTKAQVAAAKEQALAASSAVLQAIQQKSACAQDVLQSQARRRQALGQLLQAQTAPTQVAVSKLQRVAAEAKVKQARGALDEIESMLREMTVRAPAAGTVVTRFQDQGELVAAGSPVLEMVNLDRLYLKVYVPEQTIGKLRLGLPARIYTDAFPNEPFAAKVGYIASEAEFTPKEIQTATERVNLVYAVRLYLDSNPGHRLTPGMPADAIVKWREQAPWEKPR